MKTIRFFFQYQRIKSPIPELHEIKSPLVLQPGPAALTDGLDALHAIVARWATR
jgi:hypothetical protein